MKKVVASTVVIVSLGVGSLAGSVAQAAEKLRVGIVDVRKVLVESKAGQVHRAELEKLVKSEREKLAKEETSVRSLQEKLEKDKLTLTDKQKEQKQKEIETKMGALQKSVEEAKQKVAKRDNELSGAASKVVRDIIADIAVQEKLAMVMDKNQAGIFWVEEQVDITERVAKAYEAKAPK